MHSNRYVCLLVIVFSACTGGKASRPDTLINTSHLEHLFQEVQMDEQISLGTIWIYSNAPEYELVNDTDEGFTCVDDVSRALTFYCRQYQGIPHEEYMEKIESLTQFIIYMQADNGYFNNFLFPDDGINTLHTNSRATPNFWSWRAFWSLTELNLLESPELNDLKARSQPCVERLLDNILELFAEEDKAVEVAGITMPAVFTKFGGDQVGVLMAGLANYYQKNPAPAVRELILKLGTYLLAAQHGDENSPPYFSFLSWKNTWHAWGNLQAYALLYSGRILQNEAFIDAGLKEVTHFYPFCIEQDFLNEFNLTKENGEMIIRDLKRFPQISYGIRPMVYASLEAYEITGKEAYARLASELVMWYFGNNPARQQMYDRISGRGFDGINSPTKTNFNSGAESTIEALLSIQAVESNEHVRQLVMEQL
jgi:hypothetical protein